MSTGRDLSPEEVRELMDRADELRDGDQKRTTAEHLMELAIEAGLNAEQAANMIEEQETDWSTAPLRLQLSQAQSLSVLAWATAFRLQKEALGKWEEDGS